MLVQILSSLLAPVSELLCLYACLHTATDELKQVQTAS